MPQVFVKFVDLEKNHFWSMQALAIPSEASLQTPIKRRIRAVICQVICALKVVPAGKRVASLVSTVGDLNIQEHATLVVELPAEEKQARRDVTLDKFAKNGSRLTYAFEYTARWHIEKCGVLQLRHQPLRGARVPHSIPVNFAEAIRGSMIAFPASLT